ncbi:hypothetical protein P879_05125 [Paragonimus westermani]|uniref:GDP/GTP exchange factor Sec2 N-terminal domain-containing protein n=1 Tax=Paragonimus westermani TaxID=34504 RepID=A0A8T0DIJ5_9TREM|nr:hypothetical protein P879_05125 [Paragonimus westermani]
MEDGRRGSKTESSPYAMRLTDEKIKTLLEENVGLKSYIENMNTECLELNAALFDEANKMVIAARTKQHNAEKRAKERAQENELLRLQLDELRTVIASLPSPVETCGSPTVLGKSPLSSLVNKKTYQAKSFGRRRRGRGEQASDMQSTPTLYRKSCDNLSLLIAPSPGSLLTTVSRSALLDALLAEESDADELDRAVFQDFMDWVHVGCPLELPSTVTFDVTEQSVVNESHERTTTPGRIFIVRETPLELNGDEVVRARSKTLPVDYSRPALQRDVYSTASTLHRCTSHHGLAFIRRLYEDDVRPCLDFADLQLQRAIYCALPELALEMVPLNRSQKSSPDSSPTNTIEYCPLLPPLEPSYLLTVKNISEDTDQPVVARISAEARHRIAAVVNLFQYLSLIARGVVSVVTKRLNPKECDQTGCASSDTGSVHYDPYLLGKQFAKIQRIRLTIAFARLGFGLPESE